jgi:hypothetical protein
MAAGRLETAIDTECTVVEPKPQKPAVDVHWTADDTQQK